MQPDIARIKSNQKNIERTLERNQVVLELSREKSRKFARTLIEVGADLRIVRSELRQSGLLEERYGLSPAAPLAVPLGEA